MPDPTRQSVSATEASALFDVSPYVTRWMLYRRFRFAEESFSPEHNRMDWGKKMEGLILAQAAQDLKMEVRPNRGPDGAQVYVRNGLLGCTRDAEIFCPDRGPGIIEVKCVFDYRTWMAEWNGGNKVPRHNEIQVQVQMKVGAGETSPGAGDGKPYSWGVFAVWVAGDIFYFERKPVEKLWKALDAEAKRFFDDVNADKEPDPFGATIENPLMNEVWPIVVGTEIDLREDQSAVEMAEAARQFDYHNKQRLGHQKAEDALKAKFRALAKDNATVRLPYGIVIEVKQRDRAGYTVKPTKTTSVKVHVPEGIAGGDLTSFEGANIGG